MLGSPAGVPTERQKFSAENFSARARYSEAVRISTGSSAPIKSLKRIRVALYLLASILNIASMASTTPEAHGGRGGAAEGPQSDAISEKQLTAATLNIALGRSLARSSQLRTIV
jgi:hypothetical protein